jgi:hypothetical protein
MGILARIHDIGVEDTGQLDVGLDGSILLQIHQYTSFSEACGLGTLQLLTWKVHCDDC